MSYAQVITPLTMQSDNTHPVLLFPGDLGLVEDYFDPTAPSPKITSKGSLYTGGLYLRAALREMHQILRLCEELEGNHRVLLRETKDRYDDLYRWKKDLQLLDKRRSIFRPFELVAIRRAKREFCENARGLWNSIQTTSDTLRRAVLSVPNGDVAPVESEYLGKDDQIEGILTELPPPGEMSISDTQAALVAAQRVASILASHRNLCSDLADGLHGQNPPLAKGPTLDRETSSSIRSSAPPSSPGSASSIGYLNFNLSYNIVSNTDSSVPGITINNSSEGSGSAIEHRPSVNSPPS